ncbi:hypothetical protein Peur_030828 [Populus x canadensis]
MHNCIPIIAQRQTKLYCSVWQRDNPTTMTPVLFFLFNFLLGMIKLSTTRHNISCSSFLHIIKMETLIRSKQSQQIIYIPSILLPLWFFSTQSVRYG